MRKNIIILLSLLLVFGFCTIALAADQPPVTLDAALIGANTELQHLYGLTDYFKPANVNEKVINPDRWLEKNRVLFAYGDSYGDTKMTDDGIRYRYLGETRNGEDFTNPQFPHDAWNGGVIEDRTWYKYPWSDENIINKYGIKSNDFDGNSMYLPSIQVGLKMFYGDVLQGESSPYWNNWQEYIHILQPPTQYAYGLGRMWHQEPGDIMYYITIPLVPLADVQQQPTFAVTYLDSGIPGDVPSTQDNIHPCTHGKFGQKYTATVIFENISDVDPGRPVAVFAYHRNYSTVLKDANSKVVPSYTTPDGIPFQAIMLPPHSKVTLYFNWTGDEGDTSSNSYICATVNYPKDQLLKILSPSQLKDHGVTE